MVRIFLHFSIRAHFLGNNYYLLALSRCGRLQGGRPGYRVLGAHYSPSAEFDLRGSTEN